MNLVFFISSLNFIIIYFLRQKILTRNITALVCFQFIAKYVFLIVGWLSQGEFHRCFTQNRMIFLHCWVIFFLSNLKSLWKNWINGESSNIDVSFVKSKKSKIK